MSLALALREIKLLRAALECRPAYQCSGSAHRRIRLEKLANRCAKRREKAKTSR